MGLTAPTEARRLDSGRGRPAPAISMSPHVQISVVLRVRDPWQLPDAPPRSGLARSPRLLFGGHRRRLCENPCRHGLIFGKPVCAPGCRRHRLVGSRCELRGHRTDSDEESSSPSIHSSDFPHDSRSFALILRSIEAALPARLSTETRAPVLWIEIGGLPDVNRQ
jgi:hypothetical protein